jgi:hypothetical protein
MSDQVPSQFGPAQIDGRKLINVGGGAGITSINGDGTAAQVLNPGTGITITPGPPGTLTIGSAAGGGLVSLNGDGTPAQVLAAGAGISITPGPAGTNTIANTAPATPALTSINGDTTPAQSLVAGANVTITDLGGGSHRIAAAGSSGSGITSLNADTTAAQTLTPAGGSPITVSNLGGGAHNLDITAFAGGPKGAVPSGSGGNAAKLLSGAGTWVDPITSIGGTATSNAVPIPNGGVTALVSIVVPSTGGYLVVYSCTINGVAAQLLDVLILQNGTPLVAAGFSGLQELAAQTLGVSGPATGVFAGGDAITLAVNHHGGGAGTTSQNNKITLVKLG